MELSDFAIDQIKTIVSGDDGLTKYMSGRDLVNFFNYFGEKDFYNNGLPKINEKDKFSPSRNEFVIDKMKKLNGTKKIKNIIEKIVNEHCTDENYIQELVNKINKIIQPENYFLEETEGNYVVISQDYCDVDEQTETYFDDIQTKIIEEINKAKFIIWVAVAWFTDEVLFNKLVEKKNQGINVQIIIIDDEINKDLVFEKYFETYKMPKIGKFENIMHHKFCVIDLNTVIHGSYNWTKKALYNREDITIIKGIKTPERFANEFIYLKNMIFNNIKN